MLSENKLAIELSKLRGFENPEVMLEQYITPSEIAASVLWFAYMNKDIGGKTIADLGCGTGILGIGALLLGAFKVYFVDKSKEALDIAERNYKKLNLSGAEFLNIDVDKFEEKVDVVIQNPPFGVKRQHVDREFLVRALEVSNVVYSFHKVESEDFINKFCRDRKVKAKRIFVFKFPLKATQKFHTKKIHRVKVGVWRIVR